MLQKALGFRVTTITAEFTIGYLLSGSLGIIQIRLVDLAYLLLATNIVKTIIYYFYEIIWSHFHEAKIKAN